MMHIVSQHSDDSRTMNCHKCNSMFRLELVDRNAREYVMCPKCQHVYVTAENRDRIANAAVEAFWTMVADHLPFATGDLPPDDSHAFEIACKRIVQTWITFNVD